MSTNQRAVMLCSWGVKTGIANVLGGIENYVTVRPHYIIATTLKPGYLKTAQESSFFTLACLVCCVLPYLSDLKNAIGI